MRRINFLNRINRINRINRKQHKTPFPYHQFERKLIRIMVVLTVLLGLFQLKAFTDPVAFYMKLSGELDTPAFKYNDQSDTIKLLFRITPEADILLRQNDTDICVITDNKSANVLPGTVFLDATQVDYPVTVEIILNNKSYSIQMDSDIKSFEVNIKAADDV